MNETATSLNTSWTVETRSDPRVTHAVAESAILSTRSDAVTARVESWQRWNSFVQAIDHMRWLGDDWDGTEAKGPTEAVVERAIQFAEGLRNSEYPPPSRVMPGLTGSVLI